MYIFILNCRRASQRNSSASGQSTRCDSSVSMAGKSASSKCQAESQKALSKRELTPESSLGSAPETILQSTGNQPACRAPCKRQKKRGLGQETPSLCLSTDNASTKYRRPHCPMCSQLGCLRNIEVVCYCDACQESRDRQCSSPRMADFRKSHPGYASRSGKKQS